MSLALNVVLGGLIVWGPARVRTSAPSSQGAVADIAAAPASPSTHSTAKMDPSLQAAFEAGDLPGLVARLRDAGFPPDIIRAIVRAKLGEAFIARRKELDPGEATRPFWKTRPADPKMNAEIARLSAEHAKILRDLLGNDAMDPLEAAARANRLAGLPPDKVNGVKRILQDYYDMRTELYRMGPVTAADREKLAAIDKAQRADLVQLLTPAELLEYGLRSSPTADQLRWRLSAFEPSEAEFRAIYQLQAAFDEQATSYFGPMSAELQRQRVEAQKQLSEQIKAALGPERAADYERSQDSNYQLTSRLVARLNLPRETTNQVWSVQQDIQKQRQALLANRALSAEERSELLATLGEEASARISATLGARGFEAYKQYGGQWLQQLKPGASTSTPTATPGGQTGFIGR
ncbi:MAG TPA: hypothetical protein VIM71_00425 [Lacunisphaera sp.]